MFDVNSFSKASNDDATNLNATLFKQCLKLREGVYFNIDVYDRGVRAWLLNDIMCLPFDLHWTMSFSYNELPVSMTRYGRAPEFAAGAKDEGYEQSG